jgi:hypothetical protein
LAAFLARVPLIAESVKMISQRTANFYQQHGKNDFSLRFLKKEPSHENFTSGLAAPAEISRCGLNVNPKPSH